MRTQSPRQTAQAPRPRKPRLSLSERVDAAIRDAGLPEPTKEHHFHPRRKWAFDYCWEDIKLAIEVDGTGRHNTVAGMANDDEKLNEAAIMGWMVLRFNAKLVAATGKRGTGARKLPYEPLVSVLARAYQARSAQYMTNVTCILAPEKRTMMARSETL